MADITMCTQELCPNAGHCYRTTAAPSAWQSWATFDYSISTDGVVCEHYLPAYRTTATDGTSVRRKSAACPLDLHCYNEDLL